MNVTLWVRQGKWKQKQQQAAASGNRAKAIAKSWQVEILSFLH